MLDPPPETQNPPTAGTVEGRKQSDLAKRLNRYGTAKCHTLAIANELGIPRMKRMGIANPSAIIDCGEWLRFRDYFTIHQIKLVGASFCKKHLICGMCAIRRASKMMAMYLEKFQTIRRQRPTLAPYLVTLTVKNSPDLPIVVKHLLDNLRKLHRRRTRKSQPSIMHSIAGGVYSIELTHDPKTGWHPHVHAIWLSENEPDMYALRAEWHSITGDSFMCHVTPISAEVQESEDIDPFAGGFAEVFKYAMKSNELGAKRIEEAYPHLARKRLLGSFGLFRGIGEPENLFDDVSGFDHLPYVEFLSRYLNGHFRIAESDGVVKGLENVKGERGSTNGANGAPATVATDGADAGSR